MNSIGFILKNEWEDGHDFHLLEFVFHKCPEDNYIAVALFGLGIGIVWR